MNFKYYSYLLKLQVKEEAFNGLKLYWIIVLILILVLNNKNYFWYEVT